MSQGMLNLVVSLMIFAGALGLAAVGLLVVTGVLGFGVK